jgi:hypothetical protein
MAKYGEHFFSMCLWSIFTWTTVSVPLLICWLYYLLFHCSTF